MSHLISPQFTIVTAYVKKKEKKKIYMLIGIYMETENGDSRTMRRLQFISVSIDCIVSIILIKYLKTKKKKSHPKNKRVGFYRP